MRTLVFILLSFTTLFSQTFVYECQDSKSFIVQLKDNKAWLFSKELSSSLDRVPSASGEKYEKEGTVFWVEGYEAMLKTASSSYKSCSNNRSKAVWEDAKLRGNDFRAIGNEPGWYLEIANKGKKTLLVTNYGQERYELSLPRPYTSAKTSRYRIKGFLDIWIESGRCIDSMTGHHFSSRVSIKLEDKTYKGCGKALH